MTSPFTLRPATPSDIPAIFDIHKYYTLNTVITFKIAVTPEENHLEILKSVQSQHLPYIVAIVDESKPCQRMVGYTYCTGFRGGKVGYRHTVELSLFCHPEYRHMGMGTQLLNKMLEVLSKPEQNTDFLAEGVARGEDQKVRQVIACMAIDETGIDRGLGLKRWYENFGFEEVGHLKKVGHKFDRW
jgi:L-amino acid N-acyltransferase YncA